MQLLQQLSFSLSLSFVRSNKILAESMYLLQKIFPKGEHGGGLSVTRPIPIRVNTSFLVFTKDKSHPTPLVLWNERLEYHIAQMINRYHGWTLYIDFTKASRQTCEFSVKDRSLFAVYNRKGNAGCSKFVLRIKKGYIYHRAKIRTSKKLVFFFLSNFFRAFSLPFFETSAESCFSNELSVQLFSYRRYNCSQVSRQQNISKPRSFRYKANAAFEIARNYATEIKGAAFAEKRAEWIFWQTFIILLPDGIELIDSISGKNKEKEKEKERKNNKTYAIERMAEFFDRFLDPIRGIGRQIKVPSGLNEQFHLDCS